MKIIKNSKEITILEVGDEVVFGNLAHTVKLGNFGYYLSSKEFYNDYIFQILNISRYEFIKALGINTNYVGAFPEVKSLEVLTAIVSALFKECEKQNELPKTWEEFCKRNPLKKGECFIGSFCNIITEATGADRHAEEDRNYCTSRQEAEAHLALMQLWQLRKCYIGDWEPNWENAYESKYCINLVRNNFKIDKYWEASHILSFPNSKLAEQFLNNFKDLLEIAKPLL